MAHPDPNLAARDVRLAFWPLDKYPVDPVSIAESLGAEVLQAELPENVSGALFKEKGEDPQIFLQRNDSDARKRFTCAHELGHLYQHLGLEDFECIDYRDGTNSSSGMDPDEVFANQFAASLLMPENEVRKRKDLSKAELVAHFGVSGEAMKWRLRNLNIGHSEFE